MFAPAAGLEYDFDLAAAGHHRALLEYDFDSGHLKALQAIQVAGASLSLIASGFVIVSFLRFERLRAQFAFEQVANMALADVGSSIAIFLRAPRDRTARCAAQAFLGQFFQLASVFWATAIATTLVASLRRREAVDVATWRPLVYSLAYGLPFVLATLPFSTSSYGSAGAWCWIRTKPRADSNGWRFSIFYVPCWLCITYNAYVYAECATVMRRLATVVGDRAAAKLRQTVRRLVRYPAILVACWLFPTVNRVQQSVQRRPVFFLYLCTVVSLSCIGLFNALAFGATDNVKAEWRRVWRSWDELLPQKDTAVRSNLRDGDDDPQNSEQQPVSWSSEKRPDLELTPARDVEAATEMTHSHHDDDDDDDDKDDVSPGFVKVDLDGDGTLV